ncbi:MAG: hypothetical protein FWF00_00735 [Endomicrobia bacterium]|nr:hypothetical protein [Endomicrobiia bacterium]MCL2506202.1 hypothetical protein [Endomicrobiia bacterium]
MKLSKIVFVLFVFFLASNIANATTSFDDLINKRLKEQELQKQIISEKQTELEIERQEKLKEQEEHKKQRELEKQAELEKQEGLRQKELEKQNKKLELQLQQRQEKLEKRKELILQKKELDKQVKEQGQLLPSLVLDLKVGVGLITDAQANYGGYYLDEYKGITPRFEANAIYYVNRYIGLGIGGDIVSLNFKYHFEDDYGGQYSKYTAEDTSASLHAVLSYRIENFTGYLFVGFPAKIGCGIDYNINNFLFGISYYNVNPQLKGIEFSYYSLNLSVGYRLNIISKVY